MAEDVEKQARNESDFGCTHAPFSSLKNSLGGGDNIPCQILMLECAIHCWNPSRRIRQYKTL